MKNKLIIEGQEFELPESFVEQVKQKLSEEKKELSYEDVAREMFCNKDAFYINSYGGIHLYNLDFLDSDANNATTKKQLQKLFAINKLMNVAKFLNEGWVPDFKNNEHDKYSISIDELNAPQEFEISESWVIRSMDVFFKSKELAQRAIKILGEDVIRLALCQDY